MVNPFKWIGRLKKAILFRTANYILISFMGMVIAFVFSDLTDQFLNRTYRHIGLMLVQIVLVVLITCFLIPVLQYREENLMEKQGGEADIAFFKEFLNQKNFFISEKECGMYMNILWSDFPVYRMNLVYIVSCFAAGAITVLVSVGVIAHYSVAFAFMSIAGSLIVLTLPLLFQRKLEEKNSEKLVQKDGFVENLKNILANVEYIRLERQKSIVKSILNPVQREYAESMISYEKLETVLSHLVSAVLLYLEMLIYAAGCYMISSDSIDIAVFVKVVLMISVTKNGISWLMEGAQSIHAIKNSRKRIETVLPKGMETGGEPLSCLRHLVLRDVSFEYADSDTRITYPDFVLEGKKVYHLIGKNGAGKSTLLKILEKSYSGYEGDILVNGERNLREIDEKDWHDLVACIPQKPLLFHMSVRDNILLGNRNIDPELYERLINEFGIKEIEDKIVGFGGEGISGGEAQSISIVRAFLRKPRMILADEPYNTLDAHRKNTLNRYMDGLDSTIFVIVSHQTVQLKRRIDTLEISF